MLPNEPFPLSVEETFSQQKRFDWLLGFLVCRYAFVLRVITNCKKVMSPGVPFPMAVKVTSKGTFELLWEPSFLSKLTDEEATFILYHEVMHIVLHHCTSRRIDRTHLSNIAQDLAINEIIPEQQNSCTKPRNKDKKLAGTFVEDLKKDHPTIEERQSAEWYYDFLKKNLPTITYYVSGQGQPEEGQGQSEKGQGNPKDGPGMKVQAMDNHDGWNENETADERVRAIVKEIEQNNLWGSIPATLKETILAAQVRRINWRNKIRNWFGNMAWLEKDATRKRPNRRMGYAFPGFRKSYVHRWLIAMDTSGSISSDLLAQWAGVCNQLAEELPIDVMQVDCEKQTEPRPYDRRQAKYVFSGRGGTSFDPIMAEVEKRHYRGVMILTDGEAPAPTKPRNAQVLWVLPAGHKPPVEWGDRVYLERTL